MFDGGVLINVLGRLQVIHFTRFIIVVNQKEINEIID